MRNIFLPSLLFLLISGCGPSTAKPRPADLGAPADLAGIDLVAAGPDLRYPGPLYRFVLDQVRLPQTPTEYAFAPNHDGFAHNQFAKVVYALFQKNVQLQPALTVALTIDGTTLHLLTLGTTDPNLVSDRAPWVRLALARAQKRPDFTGAGTFAIDPAAPASDLGGELAAATFVGADPSVMATPPTAPLRLTLGASQTVVLRLVGAHLTFAVTQNGLMKGELHGALTRVDLDTVLLPALAASLNTLAQKANCDADCLNVRALFDYSPKDGTVTADEVRGNPSLYPLLVPDVDLYDAKGAWAPNPKNTDPDSFTVGIGFTAVKASFAD